LSGDEKTSPIAVPHNTKVFARQFSGTLRFFCFNTLLTYGSWSCNIFCTKDGVAVFSDTYYSLWVLFIIVLQRFVFHVNGKWRGVKIIVCVLSAVGCIAWRHLWLRAQLLYRQLFPSSILGCFFLL
jgi:hypothetical protein